LYTVFPCVAAEISAANAVSPDETVDVASPYSSMMLDEVPSSDSPDARPSPVQLSAVSDGVENRVSLHSADGKTYRVELDFDIASPIVSEV
jgi:hypothetical protein